MRLFAFVVICSGMSIKVQVILEVKHSLLKDLEVEIRKKDLRCMWGRSNSVHNPCVKRREDLMVQKQSIQTALDKQSEQTKSEYYTRLNASVDIVRLLLFSALPFRGHDESELLIRKGLFKDFLTVPY